ncbi:hypothetical protein JFU47_02355 [Pseudomonas sp. TH39(2020)]|uniref:hypothetical protein n=1 Tax=Pseudomonas sp. TH39(2020) TaxID=2796349 RepID=UPI00191193AF|nr:hypothetical protein [Pseudomonas sp. TH39(2020)]MBK5395585.1 hypothetical protein [Pseudomonas sp. TH39(2020)]
MPLTLASRLRGAKSLSLGLDLQFYVKPAFVSQPGLNTSCRKWIKTIRVDPTRIVILQFLEGLSAAGVNHVVLNFKYGERDAAQVVEEVGREILPRLEDSEASRMGAI